MTQNGWASGSNQQWKVFESLKDLSDRLLDFLIEWPEGSHSYFLPIDIIRTFKDPTWVHDVLQKMFPKMDTPILTKHVELICDGSTKIFAILLYSSSGKHRQAIRSFIEEGISDEDLPFSRVPIVDANGGSSHSQTLTNPRYTLGRSTHDACYLRHHNGCGIKAFSKWKRMEIQTLCRDQWTTMSPVFERPPTAISHYELVDTIVLPFIDDQEMVPGGIKEGGYSEVWATRIHPAHQNLLPSTDPLVCLKCKEFI
jgi:hypothetical protein